jgi:hypothetical protein
MKQNLNRTGLLGLMIFSMGVAGTLSGVAQAQVTSPGFVPAAPIAPRAPVAAPAPIAPVVRASDALRVGQIVTNGQGCPANQTVSVRALDAGRVRIDVEFSRDGAPAAAAADSFRAVGRNAVSLCTVGIQLIGPAAPAVPMELSILGGVATVRSANAAAQTPPAVTAQIRLNDMLSQIATVPVRVAAGATAAAAQMQNVTLDNLTVRAAPNRNFVLLLGLRLETRTAASAAANLTLDGVSLDARVGPRVAAAPMAPLAPVAAPAPAAPTRAPAAPPAPAAFGPTGPALPPRPSPVAVIAAAFPAPATAPLASGPARPGTSGTPRPGVAR